MSTGPWPLSAVSSGLLAVLRTNSRAASSWRAFLEALVVQRPTLGEVIAEDAGSPLAELNGTAGVHPVADRDYRVEVVVLDLPRDLPVPLHSNCFQNGNSCLPFKLAFLVTALLRVNPSSAMRASITASQQICYL